MNDTDMDKPLRYTCALAATLASILWIAQIRFSFPAEILFIPLISDLNLADYKLQLQNYYTVDIMYAISWMIAWVGVVHIISVRSILVARISLVVTFTGMIFGLFKNEWVTALVNFQNINFEPYWVVFRGIGDMSFVMVFIGLIFGAVGLWGASLLRRWVSVLGTTFLFPFALAAYRPEFFIVIIIWGFVWIVSLTVLLWKWARNPESVMELQSPN